METGPSLGICIKCKSFNRSVRALVPRTGHREMEDGKYGLLENLWDEV